MLDLNAPLEGLRGADYNPRRIEEDDLARLRASLDEIGIVKPIIARGDLIVAGHQRTKALRALGVDTGPVYRLPVETTIYDEIRFNQLHNGTDLDAGDEAVQLPAGMTLGHNRIKPGDVSGNMRASMAPVRELIARLIMRYGPWGACVASPDGEVIHAAQYALAACLTGVPLDVFVVPADKVDRARKYLAAQYGQFCYDELPRDTYIQTYAQMHRLRANEESERLPEGLRSTLYENMALPWLAQNARASILDFGSGQGDYFKRLKAMGLNAFEVEFYRRKGGTASIDVGAVNRQIDRLTRRLAAHGQFDAVICDSVLNSVDCREAEAAVMGTLNAMTKMGGTLFVSGRTKKQIESAYRATKRSSTKGAGVRYVEFLDEHGFSALYRKGHWFYQKFHDEDEVADLVRRYGFEIEDHNHGRTRAVSFQIRARKVRELDGPSLKSAVEYEFSLPLPNGGRYARSKDVLEALNV